MSDFVIAGVLSGKLNALVKNLMRQMGIRDPIEAVRRVNSGEWVAKPIVPANFIVWTTIQVVSVLEEDMLQKLTSRSIKLVRCKVFRAHTRVFFATSDMMTRGFVFYINANIYLFIFKFRK